jgi:hypothetical protein
MNSGERIGSMIEEATLNDLDRDKQFKLLLDELTQLKDTHIGSQLTWYKSHSFRPRISFRIVGILIILLSSSIPFIALLQFGYKDILLSIFAVMIAMLSGINSFFHWEHQWRNTEQTYLELLHLVSIWELNIVRAKKEFDGELALKVTERLFEEVRMVTKSEEEEFFKHVQLPSVSAK